MDIFYIPNIKILVHELNFKILVHELNNLYSFLPKNISKVIKARII